MDQFSKKVNEQMGNSKFDGKFSGFEEKSYTDKERKPGRHTEQTKYTIYVPRQDRQRKVFSKNEGEYIHFKEIEEEDQRN